MLGGAASVGTAGGGSRGGGAPYTSAMLPGSCGGWATALGLVRGGGVGAAPASGVTVGVVGAVGVAGAGHPARPRLAPRSRAARDSRVGPSCGLVAALAWRAVPQKGQSGSWARTWRAQAVQGSRAVCMGVIVSTPDAGLWGAAAFPSIGGAALALRVLGAVMLAAMAVLAAVSGRDRARHAGAAGAGLASAAVLAALLYGRIGWEHGARRAAWLLGATEGRWADRAAESLAAAALLGVAAAVVTAEGSAEGVRTGRVCAAAAGALALAPLWAG